MSRSKSSVAVSGKAATTPWTAAPERVLDAQGPEAAATKSRASHVDIAKGMSIAMVVLHHTELRREIPEVMSAMALFRMPLFFFLAGLFLSIGMSTKAFSTSKFSALMRPYLFTSAAILLVGFMAGSDAMLWRVKGVLYGVGSMQEWVPMWFLPHLFVALLLAHSLAVGLRLDQRSIVFRVSLLAGLVGLGAWFLAYFWMLDVVLFGRPLVLPGLPMSLDVVPITTAFVLAGFLLRKHVLSLDFTSTQAAAALCVFLAVVLLSHASVDLNLRVYREPAFATIGAATGVFLVLYIAKRIEHLPYVASMFKALGFSSLLILIFHTPLIQLVSHLSAKAGIEASPWTLMVGYLVSLAVPLLMRAPMRQVQLFRWAYVLERRPR